MTRSSEYAWNHFKATLEQLNVELGCVNIPYGRRTELHEAIKECTKAYRAAEHNEDKLQELEQKLHLIDRSLAIETVKKAEVDIPKTQRTSAFFLALEKVYADLEAGILTPARARHEVKEIMRSIK